MDNDFCKHLINDTNQALKTLVNSYLYTLDPKVNQVENLENIKKWIESHQCIDSVEIESQVLASDPPIQRFKVLIKDLSGSTVVKSIGVRLLDNKFTSDIK